MCFKPITLKNRDNAIVPCGKCPKCRGRSVSAWSFRLMQEYDVCKSAHFITLTYDTKNIPITKKGFMSLSKGPHGDLTLFFKRLRKSCGKGIKYYAAGEYGGKTKRPHYHILLFNAQLEKIQPAWGLGSIHYGSIERASVGYTLKYITKDKRERKPYWYSDQVPEFAVMSKGLGISYLKKKI